MFLVSFWRGSDGIGAHNLFVFLVYKLGASWGGLGSVLEGSWGRLWCVLGQLGCVLGCFKPCSACFRIVSDPILAFNTNPRDTK